MADQVDDVVNTMDQGGSEWEIGGTLKINAGGVVAIQAGQSAGASGQARATGNLNVQVSAAGVGNNADTTDDVLMVFALPASAFDIAGRQLNINAAGNFANNSHNKQVKIWIGTSAQTVGAAIVSSGMTAICATGVVTTANTGWEASVQVTKYGAAASNTQQASGSQSACGTTHLGTSAPQSLTMTESGAIYVAVTGASGTTGAANDVLAMLLDVAWSQ